MRAWVLQRYQVYGRICLIAAIFLSSTIFLLGALDNFNLVKLTAIWIFGVLAVAAWTIWAAERRVWPPRFYLLYAAAGFLAACTLATVFSVGPLTSLMGLHERYGGLIPFVLYAVVMVVIVGLYWERPEDLKEIVRGVGVACAVAGAYILIQAAGIDWNSWTNPGGGVPPFPLGTLGNSNFSGSLMGIALPYFLYMALSAKHNVSKMLLTVLIGLDLLALWYTHTRGGMVAAGAGLLTVAFVYRDRIPTWSKAAIGLLVAAALVVAAVLVFSHPGSSRSPGSLTKAQTFQTDTFKIRTYYWTSAWRIFIDHPVLGTGPDTYYAYYPRHRLRADGARLGFNLTDKPHNIYLEYASNTGVLGVGSYLALVGLGIWYAYRRARRLEGHERLLLATFLASLVGYLAQGAFSIDVPPLAFMGWLALGGIAALADPKVVEAREEAEAAERQKARFKPRKNKRPNAAGGQRYSEDNLDPARWPVHLSVGVVAAALLFVGARPLLADIKAKSAQVKQDQQAPGGTVASYYLDAIRLNPLEPLYRSSAARFAEGVANATSDREQKKGLLIRALVRLREAQRLRPGDLFFKAAMAQIYAVWGQQIDHRRFADADRLSAEIVAADPLDWEAHGNYAGMLNVWADAAGGDQTIRRRAAEQFEESTRLDPRRVPGWIGLGKTYLALGEHAKAEAALKQALRLEPANQEANKLMSLASAKGA